MTNADDRVEAFTQLFAAHERQLVSLAMRLVRHWADADDVLQQANLVLWKKFDQFEPGTNFYAWASRILQLEAKDFRRVQLRRQLRFGDAFSDEFLEAIADEADAMSDEFAERQRLLNDCIGRLPAAQQSLLRMRYEDGGDVDAIAAATGRTVKTIYNALGLIRKALVACVDQKQL